MEWGEKKNGQRWAEQEKELRQEMVWMKIRGEKGKNNERINIRSSWIYWYKSDDKASRE